MSLGGSPTSPLERAWGDATLPGRSTTRARKGPRQRSKQADRIQQSGGRHDRGRFPGRHRASFGGVGVEDELVPRRILGPSVVSSTTRKAPEETRQAAGSVRHSLYDTQRQGVWRAQREVELAQRGLTVWTPFAVPAGSHRLPPTDAAHHSRLDHRRCLTSDLLRPRAFLRPSGRSQHL